MRSLLLGTLLVVSLASEVRAQTLQLPTIHYFATNSSVLVPDRGSVSLGGVNRSASGSSQLDAAGLRGNQAFGSTAQAGGLSVSAHIHDFDAMDRSLLDRAAAMRRGAAVAGEKAGQSVPIHGSPPLLSVKEIRRQQAEQAHAKNTEAQKHFHKAESFRTAGNPGLAKIYYQMAANHSTGRLHEQALARYHALAQPAKIARNR